MVDCRHADRRWDFVRKTRGGVDKVRFTIVAPSFVLREYRD